MITETITPVGVSLGEPGKAANADACAHRALSTAFGTLHALIVCDGVSSSARGGDAAQLACEVFLDRCESHPPLLADAFRDDTREEVSANLWNHVCGTHHVVRNSLAGAGVCCLVAAFVLPERNALWVANVGDSSAYLFHEPRLDLLTVVDRATAVARVAGRPFLVGGVPVLRSGVTQVIGQPGEVHPHLASGMYEAGDILCLSSDGVTGAQIKEFLKRSLRPFTQEVLAAFCVQAQRWTQDDATVLVLELGAKADLDEMNGWCDRYAQLTSAERERVIDRLDSVRHFEYARLLDLLLVEQDLSRAQQLLGLVEGHGVRAAQGRWATVLNALASIGSGKLLAHATRVARTSMIP